MCLDYGSTPHDVQHLFKWSNGLRGTACASYIECPDSYAFMKDGRNATKQTQWRNKYASVGAGN